MVYILCIAITFTMTPVNLIAWGADETNQQTEQAQEATNEVVQQDQARPTRRLPISSQIKLKNRLRTIRTRQQTARQTAKKKQPTRITPNLMLLQITMQTMMPQIPKVRNP